MKAAHFRARFVRMAFSMRAISRRATSTAGVPYYERDLLNVIRQGRGVPAVPLVLIGVAP